MKYALYLFDLDDTLLDFKKSEELSFKLCLESLGIKTDVAKIFSDYQTINALLWKQFERGETTKDILKVERFRQTFKKHAIDLDPALAATRYLDTLPETVVMIDEALELCQWLAQKSEVGIITNGIADTQVRRLKKSGLDQVVSFMSVSEDCGYAKPDARFFEYTVQKASRGHQKKDMVIIGDRYEADILGARNFGIASCWYNPESKATPLEHTPEYDIRALGEMRKIFSGR